jgi:hypothetical protein
MNKIRVNRGHSFLFRGFSARPSSHNDRRSNWRGLQKKARDIPGCILEATGLSLADLHRLQREIAALRQRLLKSGK